MAAARAAIRAGPRLGQPVDHHWRRTRIPRQSPSSDGSGALATIDRAQLFANGPGVTLEQSNEVQRGLQGLMERPWVQWFPQVCISYATATRPAPLVLVLLALVRAPRMRCSAAP